MDVVTYVRQARLHMSVIIRDGFRRTATTQRMMIVAAAVIVPAGVTANERKQETKDTPNIAFNEHLIVITYEWIEL